MARGYRDEGSRRGGKGHETWFGGKCKEMSERAVPRKERLRGSGGRLEEEEREGTESSSRKRVRR